MKRIKFFGFLSIILALFGLVLIGCSQGMGTDMVDTAQGRSVEGGAAEAAEAEGGGNDGSGKDWRNDLARIKAMGGYKVTELELRQLVIETFSRIRGVNSTEPRIEKIKNIPANNKYKFKSDSASAGEGYEREPIELFEYTVSAEETTKYLLACNDARVGHILAVTDYSIWDMDNDFPAYFRASLRDYIDASILVYNDISPRELEAARAELGAAQSAGGRAVITGTGNTNSSGWTHYATNIDMTISKLPLLTTSWGQGKSGPYSSSGFAYNNYIRHKRGDNWIAGCVPVAIAQIVTCKQHMDMMNGVVTIKMAPSFNTNSTNKIPNFGVWDASKGYDFALLRSNPVIKNTAPDKVKGQVAALMYHIHMDVEAFLDPDDNKTVLASMLKAYSTFIRFGYTNTFKTPSGTETTVTGTNNGNFPITYNKPVSRVTSALNEHYPIMMAGYLTDNGKGHAWVVDGYGYASTIIEYHNKPGSSDSAQRKILLGNRNLMVHCNLGWDGDNRGYAYGGNGATANQSDKSKGGWFIYGVFNTEENLPLPTQDITAGGKNYSTRTEIIVPRR